MNGCKLISVLLVLPLSMGCMDSSETPGQSTVVKKTPENVLFAAPLISAGELQKSLTKKRICIFDLGPKPEAYQQGHIPGARFVHWIDDITDPNQPERYNIVDQETIEALMSRLAVSKDSVIVLYDDLSSRISTRMYWTLKYFGHDQVHVLDGGRSGWINAGHQLTKEIPGIKPTTYKVKTVAAKSRVNMTEVAKRLQNKKSRLIDGRPEKQFSGEEPGKVFHTGTAHKNRGHIPGAINVFWKDNFNPDGTFKSKDELKKLYANCGIQSDHQVTTYCNEGLHAAPPWFVLTQLLDYSDVSVYDDSMSEWANSDQPIEVDDDR